MPDMTISLTVQQANRMKEAYATPENQTPTIGDIKQEVMQILRAKVRHHERRLAEAAITDTPFYPI